MHPEHEEQARQRVVVLGASGMLGSALVRELSARRGLIVRGTVRDLSTLPKTFTVELGGLLYDGIDLLNSAVRTDLFAEADVVINAVGVIKQDIGIVNRVRTVEINALLPHVLAAECEAVGARFIHVSTDCVFSGRAGHYCEADIPDPVDFYGRSKLLGEVEGPSLTLRTSIVGHELQRHASLVDWFLDQPQTQVRGFTNAIYSGITTVEFANLLHDVVLPRPGLSGLYHVASQPISKFELLTMIADQYGWKGEVTPDSDLRCDRSMRADRIAAETGYRPPAWQDMVSEMFNRRPAWAITPRTRSEP